MVHFADIRLTSGFVLSGNFVFAECYKSPMRIGVQAVKIRPPATERSYVLGSAYGTGAEAIEHATAPKESSQPLVSATLRCGGLELSRPAAHLAVNTRFGEVSEFAAAERNLGWRR